MSAQFDNFNSGRTGGTVFLETKTAKGFIRIFKTDTEIYAEDDRKNTVCRTFELTENGLKWIKKSCKGWDGWQRLKWTIRFQNQIII